MKRPSAEEMTRMKESLYRDLAEGKIDMHEATRTMRKILGLSQGDYAKRVLKISTRILSAFEAGTGNPTLSTLEKIASPFGLKVGFLPSKTWQSQFHDRNQDVPQF